MAFFDYLIPLALAAVAIVLGAGLINMWRGGGEAAASRSQMLMRWRVILQFVAILIIIAAFWFQGFRP
ncbi:twin transmembrane helix small protein [Pyruvatibacter sp.]|uniref:twin transmembrane helix small protein n=1 Tax=Pyruvatibacter sp. TaxID=1981328 RepID=UPI0032EFF377